MDVTPDAVPEAVQDLVPGRLISRRAIASSSRASAPGRTSASAAAWADSHTAYARRRSSGSSPVANARVHSEQNPSTFAPASTMTVSFGPIAREPGWWCGRAAFRPLPTIGSNAIASAPSSRRVRSTHHTSSRSVRPTNVSRARRFEHVVQDARRASNRVELVLLLHCAEALDHRARGNELRAAPRERLVRCPGEGRRLERDRRLGELSEPLAEPRGDAEM